MGISGKISLYRHGEGIRFALQHQVIYPFTVNKILQCDMFTVKQIRWVVQRIFFFAYKKLDWEKKMTWLLNSF